MKRPVGPPPIMTIGSLWLLFSWMVWLDDDDVSVLDVEPKKRRREYGRVTLFDGRLKESPRRVRVTNVNLPGNTISRQKVSVCTKKEHFRLWVH
jgi:hypothetical protein